MPCWKVYLRIDRAYGLAGNKVGKVCSRKSFGRQGKFLAVLPAVSFQALLDYAVPGKIGRELEEYGEVLVAAQEAARVTELLRALLGRKTENPVRNEVFENLGTWPLLRTFSAQKRAVTKNGAVTKTGDIGKTFSRMKNLAVLRQKPKILRSQEAVLPCPRAPKPKAAPKQESEQCVGGRNTKRQWPTFFDNSFRCADEAAAARADGCNVFNGP